MKPQREITAGEIRAKMLEHLAQEHAKDPNQGNIQAGSTLRWVNGQLNIGRDIRQERMLLSEWHELFRTGILAWGHNLDNPSPPFCHVTDRGARALEHVQRDPSNPAGFMAHVEGVAELGEIAKSYLSEALECYLSGSYKAAAVMIGGASERLMIDLRDVVVRAKLSENKGLTDRRIKKVQDALKAVLDQHKNKMDQALKEGYEAYWPAFTQQVRVARNDAGHPVSIDPLTSDAVHALFLVFPQIAKISAELTKWAEANAV